MRDARGHKHMFANLFRTTFAGRRRAAALGLGVAAAVAGAAPMLLQQAGSPAIQGSAAVPPPPTAMPTPVAVQFAAVADHELPPLGLSGRIEAVQRSALGFEVDGTVGAVLVDAGDAVAAGQPLARLDRVRRQAAYDAVTAQAAAAAARLEELIAGPRAEVVERARAAVAAAEVRADLAASTARRHAEALAAAAVSVQAEEAARLEAEIAAAALREVRAVLAELEAGTRAEQLAAQRAVVAELDARRTQLARDLADCELVAPWAARVEARFVEPGVVVAAGAPVFELVGSDGLRVRVGVPAPFVAGGVDAFRRSQAGRLRATVRGAAIDVALAAASVSPRVDARVRTVDLLLPLADGATGVRDGDLATVQLAAGTRRGLAVPVTALRAGPRGLFRCFVAAPVAGDGGRFRAENRDVQVAEWLGERVLVTGGLVAGERLIVSGADHVLDGMAVVPTEVR